MEETSDLNLSTEDAIKDIRKRDPFKGHSSRDCLIDIWTITYARIKDGIKFPKAYKEIKRLNKKNGFKDIRTSTYRDACTYRLYGRGKNTKRFNAAVSKPSQLVKDIEKKFGTDAAKEFDIFTSGHSPSIPDDPFPPEPVSSDEVNLLRKKKQIILFGPPGTGKTYKTKGIAIFLCKSGGGS